MTIWDNQRTMVYAKNDFEGNLIQEMNRREYPQSLINTVILAGRYMPDSRNEIMQILEKNTSAKEVIKAIQPIVKRLL